MPGAPPNDASSTSSGLLASARRRDPEAWLRLDAIYRGLVYYWCRQRLPEDDAADVVQDVFQTVHQSLDQFRKIPGQGGFRAWLLVITNSRVADYFRRRQRRCELTPPGGSDAVRALGNVPEPSSRLNELEQPDESEQALFIRGVLDSIRSQYQERSWHAFWRIQVAGEAAREVAPELGLSVGAALMAAQRITVRLRKELAALEAEGLLPPVNSDSLLASCEPDRPGPAADGSSTQA
jgi:RNA polymerase sigma-70 factor, ECF subfamily